MRGRSLDKIKKDLTNFKRDVTSLKRSCGGKVDCTLAVATVPYPPKIPALPTEQRVVEANRFDTLSKMTDFIRELNMTEVNTAHSIPRGSYNAPTYHTWGMKTVHADPNVYGPRNRMETMVGYRAPQW